MVNQKLADYQIVVDGEWVYQQKTNYSTQAEMSAEEVRGGGPVNFVDRLSPSIWNKLQMGSYAEE